MLKLIYLFSCFVREVLQRKAFFMASKKACSPPTWRGKCKARPIFAFRGQGAWVRPLALP